MAIAGAERKFAMKLRERLRNRLPLILVTALLASSTGFQVLRDWNAHGASAVFVRILFALSVVLFACSFVVKVGTERFSTKLPASRPDGASPRANDK
jgi:uncharacterized membrane protein YtjA (UPF0391 family)